jgi:SAM-dependent MidA family methyltransferase
VAKGVAVAIDYSHALPDRRAGAHASGTLTGYRLGRQVHPVPDASCDLTTFVALDSCASAGAARGAGPTALLTQREALSALGLHTEPPSSTLAHVDPAGYLEALRDAGAISELMAGSGLGGYRWLVQGVGYWPVTFAHPACGPV